MFFFKDKECMLIIFRNDKLLKLKTLRKEEWQRKLWECGFFLPDDAPARLDVLKDSGFECRDHSLHSTDLFPHLAISKS